MRRIAIGDIHGCIKTLKFLLEELIHLSGNDRIYLVGDLIDRGPSSRDVLDYLITLGREGYNIKPVRGNHEDMFLKALENASFIDNWYANGAEQTLRSFHVPKNLIYRYECLELIPEIYINFLKSFPYFYDLGDHIIVHAGINFKTDKIFEDKEAMLWIRNMEYDPHKSGHKTIVHGHTPVPIALIRTNIAKPESKILNIDAGCVYNDIPGYGILAGIDLDTRELYYTDNID
jgi:serine/threonine protein phosphatase 1